MIFNETEENEDLESISIAISAFSKKNYPLTWEGRIDAGSFL